jgi:hypothetical protein
MYQTIQNLPKDFRKYGAHVMVVKLGYHQIEKHLMT